MVIDFTRSDKFTRDVLYLASKSVHQLGIFALSSIADVSKVFDNWEVIMIEDYLNNTLVLE